MKTVIIVLFLISSSANATTSGYQDIGGGGGGGGSSGVTGATGSIGNTGATGASGSAGLSGSSGVSGSTGITGATGPGSVNGTAGNIPVFTAATTLGNSSVTDNGTTVSTPEVISATDVSNDAVQLVSGGAPYVGFNQAGTLVGYVQSSSTNYSFSNQATPGASYFNMYTDGHFTMGVGASSSEIFQINAANTLLTIQGALTVLGATTLPHGAAFSNAPEGHMGTSTGSLSPTVSSAIILSVIKATNSLTATTFMATAWNFSTCGTNPIFTAYECGTDITCATTPVQIGTATLTAMGAVVGTVSGSPNIAAGDYVGFEITAGTCTSLAVNIDLGYVMQ